MNHRLRALKPLRSQGSATAQPPSWGGGSASGGKAAGAGSMRAAATAGAGSVAVMRAGWTSARGAAGPEEPRRWAVRTLRGSAVRTPRRRRRPARPSRLGRTRRSAPPGPGSRASPPAGAVPAPPPGARSIARPGRPRRSSGTWATASTQSGSTRSTMRSPWAAAPSSSVRASRKSASSSSPVTDRTASAKRSSQVGSSPPPRGRCATKRSGSSNAARSSIERARTMSRASPATRSIRLPMGAGAPILLPSRDGAGAGSQAA